MQTWRELAPRLSFARQLFNEAASSYDEALAQFPTRLLVRAVRLAPRRAHLSRAGHGAAAQPLSVGSGASRSVAGISSPASTSSAICVHTARHSVAAASLPMR